MAFHCAIQSQFFSKRYAFSPFQPLVTMVPRLYSEALLVQWSSLEGMLPVDDAIIFSFVFCALVVCFTTFLQSYPVSVFSFLSPNCLYFQSDSNYLFIDGIISCLASFYLTGFVCEENVEILVCQSLHFQARWLQASCSWNRNVRNPTSTLSERIIKNKFMKKTMPVTNTRLLLKSVGKPWRA